MKTTTLTLLSVCLASTLVLSGCAARNYNSIPAYSASQIGVEQDVRMGVIEAVRQVRISGGSRVDRSSRSLYASDYDYVAPRVVYYYSPGYSYHYHHSNHRGHHSSRGHSHAGAVLAGVVVGGLVGAAIASSVDNTNERDGIEITVKFNSGETKAIVQEGDDRFQVGDNVRVLSARGYSRVTKAATQ
jgi:outer membrane lipoprotein SlyB